MYSKKALDIDTLWHFISVVTNGKCFYRFGIADFLFIDPCHVQQWLFSMSCLFYASRLYFSSSIDNFSIRGKVNRVWFGLKKSSAAKVHFAGGKIGELFSQCLRHCKPF
jgi:hypothetical protein